MNVYPRYGRSNHRKSTNYCTSVERTARPKFLNMVVTRSPWGMLADMAWNPTDHSRVQCVSLKKFPFLSIHHKYTAKRVRSGRLILYFAAKVACCRSSQLRWQGASSHQDFLKESSGQSPASWNPKHNQKMTVTPFLSVRCMWFVAAKGLWWHVRVTGYSKQALVFLSLSPPLNRNSSSSLGAIWPA